MHADFNRISSNGQTIVCASYDTKTVHVFYNDDVDYDWWWVSEDNNDGSSKSGVIFSMDYVLGHILPLVVVLVIIAVLVVVYRRVPADRVLFSASRRYDYLYDEDEDVDLSYLDDEEEDEDWG